MSTGKLISRNTVNTNYLRTRTSISYNAEIISFYLEFPPLFFLEPALKSGMAVLQFLFFLEPGQDQINKRLLMNTSTNFHSKSDNARHTSIFHGGLINN